MKNEWNAHKDEGFRVPSGYFEGLEERIADRINLEHLQSKEDDGFVVPEYYFENFKVQKPDKKQKLITMSSIRQPLIWTAIAAAIALLFMLQNSYTSAADPLENISSTSLSSYFENQDIQEYLTEEELSTIENNANFIKPSSISDDLIYEAIDKDILEEEPEPTLATN